jgi:hypothetical protein
VADCCECGDESSGSCATELVLMFKFRSNLPLMSGLYNPSLPLKIIQLYLIKVDVFTTCFGPTGVLKQYTETNFSYNASLKIQCIPIMSKMYTDQTVCQLYVHM